MENMNARWHSGEKITDKELIEQFDLDPALEGTKEINKAFIDAAHKQTVIGMVDQGYSSKFATEIADDEKRKALDNIRNVEEYSGLSLL